jgi:hypothetical protein
MAVAWIPEAVPESVETLLERPAGIHPSDEPLIHGSGAPISKSKFKVQSSKPAIGNRQSAIGNGLPEARRKSGSLVFAWPPDCFR